MELFKASHQWATRPADERFWTLQEMNAACKHYASQAKEIPVYLKDLRVETVDGDVRLTGRQGVPATLTHFAFGQLCNRVGAPASYMRELPATLAAQNMNHGLAKCEDTKAGSALIHQNGSTLLRAITSDRYTRIWNHDITSRLLDLEGQGWRVPPARPVGRNTPGARAATQADVLASNGQSLAVKVGDMIAPAGLYASDHDMFAFMVNEDRRIDDGSTDGLARGVFCWNSEVGAKSFGVTQFLYQYVCGNHIVWGAKDVREIRIRHIGNADERAFRNLRVELKQYADESASDLEGKIQSAKTMLLGASKSEVIDAIFGRKIQGLTKALITTGYEIAENRTEDYGNPRSVWGMVQGLTQASQEESFTDNRVVIDVAVGKLLDSAF